MGIGGKHNMNITMWKRPTNFKIKSMFHVKRFLNELLHNGHYYIYESNHELIVIHKKDNDIQVLLKVGQLDDLFNPMFEIPDDEIVKFLFKKRKALNNYFFNDKEV